MTFPERARPARRAARDRHNRGLRGPLVPATTPLSVSRAERFDELVVDAVSHLGPAWQERLRDLEVAVEDVPPVPDDAAAAAAAYGETGVPLAETHPAARGRRPRLVVYRRPIEARAVDHLDLADLVHDIVVEEIADFLGVDPDVLDPPA